MSQDGPSISNITAIDEIPTQPSARKAVVVSIASVMLGLLGLGFWHYGLPAYATLMDNNVAAQIHLQNSWLAKWLPQCFVYFGYAGMACGIAGLLSLIRVNPTYQLLRAALFLVYPVVLGYVLLVWLALFDLVRAGVEFDSAAQDRATGTLYWWSMSWPALAVGCYTFWLHMMVWSRSVNAAFTREVGPAMRGDRVLEDWRTHGKDPRARRGVYSSFTTHVVILVIIPFLLQSRGCIEAYKVPKGSGEPVVVEVPIVQPKKKKMKKLTLRPDSAVLTDITELPDETEVDKQMAQETTAEYKARVLAQKGRPGVGGGPKGGWPEGMEDYEIRFIRIDHGGKGWDDGMNQTAADVNFLRAYANLSGFSKVASEGESIPISALDGELSDGLPPFVYITGNGRLGSISNNDKKILRRYCMGGGMLIADAGSKAFGDSFRTLMSQVFSDKKMRDITRDDMLFQLPYSFPDGPPPLWAHDGSQAMGIQDGGRWMVFYHPGDMNDAWKSDEYIRVEPEVRDAAIFLGVNLVNYSFTQWNDAMSKQR